MKALLFNLLVLFLSVNQAHAKLNVIASSPDIAWALRAIGGQYVEVESLLEGSEDAHHVDIVPSFVQKVSRADLVCSTGLSLEIAWLPKVIARSNNKKLLSLNCELGSRIQALEKGHGRVDRSMGDVHSDGNPHFTLSPTAMIQGLDVVVEALSQLKPEHAQDFKNNHDKTVLKLKNLLSELKSQLNGKHEHWRLMEYHREFSYFLQDYGLESLGSLEEIPGAPPSAGRLAERVQFAREFKVSLVLASQSAPERLLKRFSELSGIEVVIFPTMMESSGLLSDYFEWQRFMINEILKKIPPHAS